MAYWITDRPLLILRLLFFDDRLKMETGLYFENINAG
jgi:hypothetical protein